MPITSLQIKDFRNLADVAIKPCPLGLNIFLGNNGSGKTSILEALHYLSLGRSFRSSTNFPLIRQTCQKFSLFANAISELHLHIGLGVERDLNGGLRLRVAEKDVSSIVPLTSILPLRVINSQSHNLFESGPSFRRKYLDWGLFYQIPSFLDCWRNFERVLKQRNTLLREGAMRNELAVWTDKLITHGLELDCLRRDYISLLIPHIQELARKLLAISDLSINYYAGWDKNKNYVDVLAAKEAEERRFGYTQYGPHRADLDIEIAGVSSKHFLSRGQQKLLICAMILAQGNVLKEGAHKNLIYLVDDLPSELDIHSRQKLISQLSMQQTQIFITAVEQETIESAIDDKQDVPIEVFHVEQGRVMSMPANELRRYR